jgi:hypothetical protein
MEKVVKYLPFGLFCALSSKLLFAQNEVVSFLSLTVLALVVVYFDNKKNSKKADETKMKIEELEKKVLEYKEEVNAVKNNLVGIKISQQVKNFSPRG